ncbi:MAG: protein phosphatase 2C domain-containing protein [Candidatus Aenigmatarchaeota archaeon]
MKVDFVFDEGSSKEDTYLIGQNIFGVFDGANSINKFFDENGKSGGLMAASIVRDEFAANKGTLKEMAIKANNILRKKMISNNIDVSDKASLWCTTAAAVRIKNKTFEWLHVADSLILVIYMDDSFKLLAHDYDHDRGAMIVWKKLAQEKRKNIHDIIWKKTPHTRFKSNEAYGMINGEEKFSKFILTGEENLENVKHILIFTDGLILPKEDPEKEDNFNAFVRLFLKGGLKNVMQYVRDLEKDDPECWKYPRYKQYDDITAISISF